MEVDDDAEAEGAEDDEVDGAELEDDDEDAGGEDDEVCSIPLLIA